MINDFKAALQSGKHSDVIVEVKGEEFRLHKVILSARNPYFDSVFNCDLLGRSTHIVTIKDTEPHIFRSFIHFLYTGEVDKLSPENVCDLYVVAEKFQEDQLKKMCLQLMLNTLSVNSFYDYIILALRYINANLFQKYVEFFIPKGKKNAHDIK